MAGFDARLAVDLLAAGNRHHPGCPGPYPEVRDCERQADGGGDS